MKGLPLSAALSGSLPCIGCGYELKGMSIRSVCPECGTAIRATILYKVDPEADEFRPMLTPRLTAACLVTLPASAFLLALSGWAVRIADISAILTGVSHSALRSAAPWDLYLAVIAGLSTLGLIRPSSSIAWWKSLAASVAALCFLPLVWAVHEIGRIDAQRSMPYFSSVISRDRVELHMVLWLCLGLIVVGLRPVARDLVRRSLALRTGRVDRQTMLAMIVASALVLIGDAGRWWSATGEQPHAMAVGTLIVALGALFVTVGLATAIVDGWRIGLAIRQPAPGRRQVFGDPPPGLPN